MAFSRAHKQKKTKNRFRTKPANFCQLKITVSSGALDLLLVKVNHDSWHGSVVSSGVPVTSSPVTGQHGVRLPGREIFCLRTSSSVPQSPDPSKQSQKFSFHQWLEPESIRQFESRRLMLDPGENGRIYIRS